MDFLSLLGIPVVVDPLAAMPEVTFTVMRHPTQKRRRQWSVTRVTKMIPGAFTVGGVMHVHPTVFEKLKESGA